MEDYGYGAAQWCWDNMEPSGGFYEEEDHGLMESPAEEESFL